MNLETNMNDEIPPAQGDEFDDDVEEEQRQATGVNFPLLYHNQPRQQEAQGLKRQVSMPNFAAASRKRPAPMPDFARLARNRPVSMPEFATAASSASFTEDDDFDADDYKVGSGRKKKIGRPKGKPTAPAPAKTVAASTNAEKRQKIRNLFHKVATVDLVTDIENASAEDPITKFVLIQVSTAPPPPVEGGGPHRKVVAEKVKRVTIYGGPTDMDLRTTLAHASAALAVSNPSDYNVFRVHNLKEVGSHFKRIEEERRAEKSLHS
jgi:hypothetical protein